MTQSESGLMDKLNDPKIDPRTLEPYATQASIQSENFKLKDDQGENGEGWELRNAGPFILEADKVTVNGAEISAATVKQATLDNWQLKMKDGLAHGFEGVGMGLTIPTDQLNQTPRDPRLIAMTQRKIDDLEAQIASLLREVSSYSITDQYVLKLAKDNLTMGPILLHKALADCQLDDGK